MKTDYTFPGTALALAMALWRGAEAQASPPPAPQTAIEDSTVEFNLWLVVMLALLPVLALFVGMSVSAGFPSATDWDVIAAIAGGVGVTCALARRAVDRTSAAGTASVAERSSEK